MTQMTLIWDFGRPATPDYVHVFVHNRPPIIISVFQKKTDFFSVLLRSFPILNL